MIAVGLLVGFTILVLGCLAAYALVWMPDQNAEATAIAQAQTQEAVAALSLTQTAQKPSPTVEIQPSATSTMTPSQIPTETPSPTPTATATPTPSATPTATATREPTATLSVIFQDDFSGPASGWATESDPQFDIGYIGEAYFLRVKPAGTTVWSVRQRTYNNVLLEVSIVGVEGTQSGFYGLVCRFVDGSNYYGLVVNQDREFRIFKNVRGVPTNLVGPTALDGSVQTDTPVRIRADCIDDTLRLSVNGAEVAQVTDRSLQSGIIGLLAGTTESESLLVQYDDFLVARP